MTERSVITEYADDHGAMAYILGRLTGSDQLAVQETLTTSVYAAQAAGYRVPAWLTEWASTSGAPTAF